MSILEFAIRRSSEAGDLAPPAAETLSGEMTMRFMMIVKASKDSEAGKMPSEELIAEMGRYNEQLAKAGILLDAAGLQASSKGARVKFSPDGKKTLVDGPFTESKELIAGYWIIQVKSPEEAREWAKRAPSPHPGEECEIELRRFFEMEDFPPSEGLNKQIEMSKELNKQKGK
jgi:hypothetical protein